MTRGESAIAGQDRTGQDSSCSVSKSSCFLNVFLQFFLSLSFFLTHTQGQLTYAKSRLVRNPLAQNLNSLRQIFLDSAAVSSLRIIASFIAATRRSTRSGMKWVKPVGFRGHRLSDSLWMSQLMMLGINRTLLFTTYTKWLAEGNPVRMIIKVSSGD